MAIIWSGMSFEYGFSGWDVVCPAVCQCLFMVFCDFMYKRKDILSAVVPRGAVTRRLRILWHSTDKL